MTVCDTCRYPYPGDGCDNPACLANPILSEERKAQMKAEYERRQQERDERAMLDRARRQAFTRRMQQ